jgi:hypothetical protein
VLALNFAKEMPMPTPDQLKEITPTDGDGSTTTENPDGTKHTGWSDGVSRNDNLDGSAVVTFPDGSTLDIEPDGSETLTDVNGNQLDLTTGKRLDGKDDEPTPTAPPPTVDQVKAIVDGLSSFADLAEAQTFLNAAGLAATASGDEVYSVVTDVAKGLETALKGGLSVLTMATMVFDMACAGIKAFQTQSQGVATRAWCYTVLYDALGMGTPADPAESDPDNLTAWHGGVADAQKALSDGQNGVALRNQVFLVLAKCGGDPSLAITALWSASCNQVFGESGPGSLMLKAYPQLWWPQPEG